MRLTSKEASKIEALLRDMPSGTDSLDPERFAFHCQELGKRLPERLRKCLFDMRLKGLPYVLISGLPMARFISSTPVAKTDCSQSDAYYQNLISVVSAQLGFLYRFASKQNRSVIEDIFPIEAHRHKQMGTNSVCLDWHVEDAFHRARADYISLLCLREDPEAKTLLFVGAEALPHIPSSVRAELSRPSYFLRSDASIVDRPGFGLQTFVLENSDDPEILFDPSFTDAPDAAATSAMDALAEHISRSHEAIALERGDLLVFDNRRVAHSRSEYSPRYDGGDRWLLRGLIVESTWKLKNFLTKKDCITVM